MTRSLRVVFSTSLAVLAACSDHPDSIAGIPSGAADGLYPQVIIAGSAAPSTEVRLSLLRKPAGTRLGSYQGVLIYDPAVLRFESASLPEGVDGAASAITPGQVRFVGSALDGVGEVPLMTARFSRTGPVDPGAFGVQVEEVTALDLSDVTAQVVSGTPLVGIANR
jgi:hypothetical protein